MSWFDIVTSTLAEAEKQLDAVIQSPQQPTTAPKSVNTAKYPAVRDNVGGTTSSSTSSYVIENRGDNVQTKEATPAVLNVSVVENIQRTGEFDGGIVDESLVGESIPNGDSVPGAVDAAAGGGGEGGDGGGWADDELLEDESNESDEEKHPESLKEEVGAVAPAKASLVPHVSEGSAKESSKETTKKTSVEKTNENAIEDNPSELPAPVGVSQRTDVGSEEVLKLKAEIGSLQKLVATREKDLEQKTIVYSSLYQKHQALEAKLAEAQAAKNASEVPNKKGITIEKLQNEFSLRLGSLDSKVSSLTKERDRLKRDFGQRDKEATQKEEELTKKVEELTSAVDAKRKKIATLEDTVQKYEAAMDEMKTASSISAKRLEKNATAVAQSTDQVEELKNSLEKVEKELASQQKENRNLIATHAAEIEMKEFKMKEEYHQLLAEQVRTDVQKEEELKQIIATLRSELTDKRDVRGNKEEDFQRDINELMGKIEMLEQVNAELSESQVSSTKPIFRRVTELENQLEATNQSFSSLEQNLRSRLREEIKKVKELEYQKRLLVEKADTLEVNSSHYNNQVKQLNDTLRQKGEEKKVMEDKTRKQIAILQNQVNDKTKILEEMKEKMESLAQTLKETRDELFSSQEIVKMLNVRHEQELQLLKMKMKKVNETGNTRSPHSPSLSTVTETSKDEINSTVYHTNTTISNGSGSDKSPSHVYNNDEELDDFISATVKLGSLGSIDKLRHALVLKKGEVIGLKSDIESLRKSKRVLESEVVLSSTKLEATQKELSKVSDLQKELEDTQNRYMAALEMLGERSERADELESDLSEFKALYRQQVDTLCAEIERLTKLVNKQES